MALKSSFTMGRFTTKLHNVSLLFSIAISCLAMDLYILPIYNNKPITIPVLTLLYCCLVGSGWMWVVDNKRKWYIRSIRRFYWHRILMPTAVVCLNILLPLVMVLNFYGSWFYILITILIYALYAYLAVGTTERFFAYEEEFRYTIPKSVKLTSLQMIYTIIFFVCSQTYYISLSCMTYYPFQQEKIAIKFWSPTLLFCPLINIFTLPTIHLAICVHNSNSIHFSRQHPGTRLKWDGMKKWNAISGKWEIDESPKDHEILNLC
ncbi:Serpentine Receptor, class U [Caenorhabditis elegans]|uniref:Serpentine Receptor, class U n=1 Tax=Caenorhabditis elegans TaxID=6239 RepID=Q5GMI1_CAEEL|nr:Serpentine Receptor, class U [Caenorhabditis elegans]CAI46616.1 Serpentine Receptor, class U [Caenorhabditis elegans]|eukprot:NP_001022481.1 Uncharacterized protein CELE_Y57A10C.11 [Caenorhabditis elegans]